MLKLLSLLTLCALTTSFAPNAPSSDDAIEVVGPSVLLNAREMGAVNILDLRMTGRAVPDARRDFERNGAPLFILADESIARDWLTSHHQKRALIIPPRFIEYEKMAGVPQIEPRAAQAKVDEGWPLFDISEQWEFDKSRLPNSRRLDYGQFRGGDWGICPQINRLSWRVASVTGRNWWCKSCANAATTRAIWMAVCGNGSATV